MFLYDPEMTSIGLFAKPHIFHVPEKLYRITMDHHFPRFSRSQYVPIDMPRMWCFPMFPLDLDQFDQPRGPRRTTPLLHIGVVFWIATSEAEEFRVINKMLLLRALPYVCYRMFYFFSKIMIRCFVFCIVWYLVRFAFHGFHGFTVGWYGVSFVTKSRCFL